MAKKVSDETPCIIARKDCGCVVAAAVNTPEERKDNAKEVARWVRQGYRIETQSVEWVRANMKRCPHEQAPTASGSGTR